MGKRFLIDGKVRAGGPAAQNSEKERIIMFMPNIPQGFGLEIILIAEVGYL